MHKGYRKFDIGRALILLFCLLGGEITGFALESLQSQFVAYCLPIEVVDKVICNWQDSARNFFINTLHIASINRRLSEEYGPERTVNLFYDLFATRLMEKTHVTTGDNIFHWLARHRKYDLLGRLIQCGSCRRTKRFAKCNHFRESPFLTLLRHKLPDDHSIEFNNVFNLLLKVSRIDFDHKCHDLFVRSPEITSKLTAIQSEELADFTGTDNEMPLLSDAFHCAMKGDLEAATIRVPIIGFRFFRDYIYDFRPYGYYGETVLHVAARNGHTDYLRQLLLSDQGREAIDCQNGAKQTPLMRAVRGQSLDCVKLLLDHGADIEATDSRGRTSIMWAARTDNLLVFTLLHDRGAKIDVVNEDYECALTIAGRKHSEAIVDYLLSNGRLPKKLKDHSLCTLATLARLPQLIDRLHRCGYSVDDSSRKGATALMCAAANGRISCVTKLLELKAQINKSDIDGRTAIYYASSRKNKRFCANTKPKKAVKITTILANALKEQNVAYPQLAREYMVLTDNGFEDAAAIIKICLQQSS